jgi:cell division protein FtsW (lipid II flippase)
MPDATRSTARNQSRLLLLAALFLMLYTLALTLAPAARARSWDTGLRWGHWLGLGIWLIGFGVAHRQIKIHLPKSDPYLLPLIALLSGWGLVTIWRLAPTFGLRQTIWLALTLSLLILGLRIPDLLPFLRRYKYIWLTSGLLLTALTLIFGSNPMGAGPRLWLGCCGIYLQPSEPLKLLLIIYLSAYFADWSANVETLKRFNVGTLSRLHILVPTIIMTSLALLLLIVQRDLGTASIFVFIYSAMIYLATGWRLVPLVSAIGLGLAGFVGYAIFDVIRLRVEAWLNPWLDPSGRSYQIVQSLLAVANGGIFGRGPGMGNPTLVPVSHSDFVFAAIAEETGLVGALALLLILALLAHRGLRIALHTRDTFQRYLAAGLTAFLTAQSILIIGGNLRLFPLTGVTLPFVSYGGSSLVVSFVSALILLKIGAEQKTERSTFNPSTSSHRPDVLPGGQAIQRFAFSLINNVSALLFLGLAATSLLVGWWAFYRGPDLLTRTDNARRAIADRSVRRGTIYGRNETIIAQSVGQPGEYLRQVEYPDLGPVLGYIHPVYGQSGLEDSLDPILRGVQGNDPLQIWWHHLLYGQPPPGLDIRLTIDLKLQRTADQLLTDHAGALVLLNAKTGEILVMASHPTYNANQLNDLWDSLIQDPQAPLLNRATQGSYPLGDLGLLPFIQALDTPTADPIALRLPFNAPATPLTNSSPLQVAIAAASLSNNGNMPAPRLALSYRSPVGEWIILPPLGTTSELLSPTEADALAANYQLPDLPTWQIISTPSGENLTWYLSGTVPGSANIPLALALVLEEKDAVLAEQIGQAVLNSAISP